MAPKPKNNFDVLRLIASCLVFFSHSFVVYGLPEPGLLVAASPYKEISFGTLGVSIFFVVSGYLVTASWERSRNAVQFLQHRALRLYPALGVNIAITLLVLLPLALGAQVYTDILAHSVPIIVRAYYFLDVPNFGNFFPHNPFPNAINESLWTLRYEVLCYCVVALLGVSMRMHKNAVAALLLAYVFFFYKKIFFPISALDLAHLHCSMFLLGSLFYGYRRSIPLSHIPAAFCLATLLWMAIADMYLLLLYAPMVTYLVVYCAEKIAPLKTITPFGDFSYGIYLYAFPVQQIVGSFYKFAPAHYVYYFITSFSGTLLLAMFSWYAIERHALKLKQKQLFR